MLVQIQATDTIVHQYDIRQPVEGGIGYGAIVGSWRFVYDGDQDVWAVLYNTDDSGEMWNIYWRGSWKVTSEKYQEIVNDIVLAEAKVWDKFPVTEEFAEQLVDQMRGTKI